MWKGLEYLTKEERIKAGTAQPRKEKTQGSLTNVQKHPRGGLLTVASSDRTKGKEQKLKYRTFSFSDGKRLPPRGI